VVEKEGGKLIEIIGGSAVSRTAVQVTEAIFFKDKTNSKNYF
jgi:hypothetical protein